MPVVFVSASRRHPTRVVSARAIQRRARVRPAIDDSTQHRKASAGTEWREKERENAIQSYEFAEKDGEEENEWRGGHELWQITRPRQQQTCAKQKQERERIAEQMKSRWSESQWGGTASIVGVTHSYAHRRELTSITNAWQKCNRRDTHSSSCAIRQEQQERCRRAEQSKELGESRGDRDIQRRIKQRHTCMPLQCLW